MKILQITSIGFTLLLLSSLSVFAQTETPTMTINPTKSAVLTQAASRREAVVSKMSEKKQESQDRTIENLKNRAVTEIDRRIEAMSKLTTKITDIKKLTAAQKTDLSSQIQIEINNLTSLKTKIQADTDIDVLRADTKSIYASYRIYALFLPKIYILTTADGLTNAGGKMTSVSAELSTRIQKAKDNGQDTTLAEAELETLQKNISDATNQIALAINTVMPLTPAGYPGNKTSLESARKNLKLAHDSLNASQKNARAIIKLLKEAGVPANTTTTSSSQ